MLNVIRLIGTIGLSIYALDKLFSSNDPKPTGINGIPNENVIEDYLFRFKIRDNESNVRRRITRSINLILNNNPDQRFKIGKTGAGAGRHLNYSNYQFMFLLCKSSREDYIDNLEAHYIDSYIRNPLNDNKNVGSAGKMQSNDGLYYLYLVIE